MSTQSSQNSTVTVRLPHALQQRLAELAGHTQRSKSFLAREAITTYVEQQLAIVEGVERGVSDIQAGHTVTHEEALKRIYRAANGK